MYVRKKTINVSQEKLIKEDNCFASKKNKQDKKLFRVSTYHVTPPPKHIHLNPHTHLINSKKGINKKKQKPRRGKKKKEKARHNNNNPKKKMIIIIIIAITIPTSTTNIHIHHFKTTSMCPRSIAGVLFDSVGILGTTFVLCTTCMRSCCTWSASCVTV